MRKPRKKTIWYFASSQRKKSIRTELLAPGIVHAGEGTVTEDRYGIDKKAVAENPLTGLSCQHAKPC
jgi:hypothetical protein